MQHNTCIAEHLWNCWQGTPTLLKRDVYSLPLSSHQCTISNEKRLWPCCGESEDIGTHSVSRSSNVRGWGDAAQRRMTDLRVQLDRIGNLYLRRNPLRLSYSLELKSDLINIKLSQRYELIADMKCPFSLAFTVEAAGEQRRSLTGRARKWSGHMMLIEALIVVKRSQYWKRHEQWRWLISKVEGHRRA